MNDQQVPVPNPVAWSIRGHVAVVMPLAWCGECGGRRPHLHVDGGRECRACLARAAREAV